MTALGYTSTTVTAEDTHTGDSTWTDITGAVIADAAIVDSAEYLLIVTAQVSGGNNAQTFGFRTVHGTGPTIFNGSTFIFEPRISGTSLYRDYMFMHKFTASASAGENIIKCQFQSTSDTGETVRADTIVMLAINLDTLDAADWHYGEDDDTASPVEFTTSFADFATTGAFTPNGTDDWLILFCINWLVDAVNVNTEIQLRLDGTTASPADNAPFISEEGEDVEESKVYGMSRVFTPTNASHQWWVQGRDDATGVNDHQYSAVFALRLNAFQDHVFGWIEADLTPSVDDTYEEVLGTTIGTPSANIDVGPVTSDIIAIASAVADHTAERDGGLLLTLGGTVTPVGRDGHDVHQDDYDASDEQGMFTMFIATSQSGALDIDLDAKVQAVADGVIEDRSMVVFSAELAAVVGGATGIRNPMAGPMTLRRPLGVG